MARRDNKASHRLAVLKLAKEIGVSAACAREGMDRTSFYKWKRRYAKLGIKGLEDRSRAHKSHSMKLKPEVVRKIERLALLHPGRGCDWLAVKTSRAKGEGTLQGVKVSKTTVQTVIGRAGIGTKADRWLALERRIVKEGHDELTPVQARYLEARNPNHREIGSRSRRPGELLFCDTVLLGSFGHLGRVYMHAVVDSYSAYAFATLVKKPTAKSAHKFFEESVLKFLAKRGVAARQMQVTQAWNRNGDGRLVSNIFALKYGISTRQRPSGHSRISGFVESFQKAARADFVKEVKRTSSGSWNELKAVFFRWRRDQNNRRFEGYPCFGKSPNERFRGKA